MRRFTNSAEVPLSMAVFLATDSYDHDSESISATALLKPLKQIILSSRVPQEQGLVDISGLVSSRMGTALHDAIERSWLHNYQTAMKALGYPQKVIDRVLVNPTNDELYEGCIPVYLEQRSYKVIDGIKVSGKYDFVGEGRLEDFKSTSTFTWVNGTKDDDYILQGSIYRWLNPEIITQDRMAIQFIFTDWQAAQARANPKYPQSRTVQKLYPLKSLAETEQFVRSKLRLIQTYKDAPEADLPHCTDEELWRSEPQWKYYKDPNKTARSTKNFDNKQEAYLRMAQDGNVGIVKEVPGKAVACKYCPAFPICAQARALVEAGDLDI